MGQSWSSHANHVEGMEPIHEMLAPLPSAVKSRAQIRFQANKKYPDAGAAMAQLMRQFVSVHEKNPSYMSIRASKSTRKHAGLVLVEKDREADDVDAFKVKSAMSRILPGLKSDTLESWITECISEPFEDGSTDQITSEASVQFSSRNATHLHKDRRFDVEVLIRKQLLKESGAPNVLLSIAIIVGETCPSSTDLFQQIRSCTENCTVNFCQEYELGGKRWKIVRAVHPPPDPNPTLDDKRLPMKCVNVGESCESSLSKYRTKSKVGAPQQWSDKEKSLLVHFYHDHFNMDSKLNWSRAAALWCDTFNRHDTVVQLESNRRRFERLGYKNDGTHCLLCHGSSANSESSEEELEKMIVDGICKSKRDKEESIECQCCGRDRSPEAVASPT